MKRFLQAASRIFWWLNRWSQDVRDSCRCLDEKSEKPCEMAPACQKLVTRAPDRLLGQSSEKIHKKIKNLQKTEKNLQKIEKFTKNWKKFTENWKKSEKTEKITENWKKLEKIEWNQKNLEEIRKTSQKSIKVSNKYLKSYPNLYAPSRSSRKARKAFQSEKNSRDWDSTERATSINEISRKFYFSSCR